MLILETVSHYHTPTNGAHGPHSHVGLLFREGWNLGNFVSSGIWQGSGFRHFMFTLFHRHNLNSYLSNAPHVTDLMCL